MFISIKDRLDNHAVLQLLAVGSYENSMERARQKAEEYQSRHNWNLYGWVENDEIIGSCGYKVYHTDRVEIMSIAVVENMRGRGIGSAMIDAVRDEFLLPIHAETDDDAVDFYRKVGFEATAFEKSGYRRYACVLAASDFTKTVDGLIATHNQT